MSVQEVENMTLAQKRMAAMIMETTAEEVEAVRARQAAAEAEAAAAVGGAGGQDDQDDTAMEQSDDEDDEVKERKRREEEERQREIERARAIQASSEVGGPMKIKTDYVPKPDSRRRAAGTHAYRAARPEVEIASTIMLATMGTSAEESMPWESPNASRHIITPLDDAPNTRPRPLTSAKASPYDSPDPTSEGHPSSSFPAANGERDAAQARKNVLSEIESRVHHRSRRVTQATATRLVFSVSPTTSTDPVAPLAPDAAENKEFMSYRTWLRERNAFLDTELASIGDKDADNRRASLLRRMESELRRLDDLEEYCWDRTKILTKLPGLYFLSDAAEPIIIPPRALSRPSNGRTLY
ncbi:hypothetical protein NUW54_g13937 [Trametes sanguinea]|uniref:Uncharacterized protein n=1 Tax=Trametes sanguinea TaxID=158606 RepID=A0ACC1MI23_9APHY|nr:hypothetical protein NUW54_g13937 [Trametes sanguinea]